MEKEHGQVQPQLYGTPYLFVRKTLTGHQYVTALVDNQEPLSRETILALHALVMDKILETKGSFRTRPVYIRGANMTPPAASEVERLMGEWVAWVHGEGRSYEPVTRAAIAHHGFEAVHPFEDGNGRVGRLLLNLMLMREGYPPALLLRDWRARYIHGLNQANTGSYGPLVNLVGQAVEAGLDLYLEACAATPLYQSLRELAEASGYPLDYLSWLARQGRLEAVKRGGRWYSTLEAVERYRAQAEEGKKKRGRPPSRTVESS